MDASDFVNTNPRDLEPTPCAACQAVECPDCDGTVWDLRNGQSVPCPCHEAGHIPWERAQTRRF